MSRPDGEESAAQRLERVESELRAAEMLLLDAELPVEVVTPHLRGVAQALEVEFGPLADDESERDWAWGQLRRLSDRFEAEQRDVDPQRNRQARLARWVLGASLLLVPALVYVIGTWITTDPQPWRAAYYGNQHFDGEPVIYWENDIDHDWGELPPVDELPPNEWSASFETCLVVEKRTKFVFQLSSDDGSRLFIDGKMVVGNWGVHRMRSRTGKIRLDPGEHSIEIQYFDRSGYAGLVLLAVIRRGTPARLPLKWLRAPDDDAPLGKPCQH